MCLGVVCSGENDIVPLLESGLRQLIGLAFQRFSSLARLISSLVWIRLRVTPTLRGGGVIRGIVLTSRRVLYYCNLCFHIFN